MIRSKDGEAAFGSVFIPLWRNCHWRMWSLSVAQLVAVQDCSGQGMGGFPDWCHTAIRAFRTVFSLGHGFQVLIYQFQPPCLAPPTQAACYGTKLKGFGLKHIQVWIPAPHLLANWLNLKFSFSCSEKGAIICLMGWLEYFCMYLCIEVSKYTNSRAQLSSWILMCLLHILGKLFLLDRVYDFLSRESSFDEPCPPC